MRGQCGKHESMESIAMKGIDRFLIGSLAAGVWVLAAIQLTSTGHAQESVVDEQRSQETITVVRATEIVGLSAMIQQTVRDYQFRPQSMPGLDQYVKSIVRNCRISGSVSAGRLSATNISC